MVSFVDASIDDGGAPNIAVGLAVERNEELLSET